MVVQCCGYPLSETGVKVLRWGWPLLSGVTLLIGIILTGVGHTNGDGGLYGGGVVMILAAIVVFLLWICYQCNIGGWKDPGCSRCILGCGMCCPQQGYGEL